MKFQSHTMSKMLVISLLARALYVIYLSLFTKTFILIIQIILAQQTCKRQKIIISFSACVSAVTCICCFFSHKCFCHYFWRFQWTVGQSDLLRHLEKHNMGMADLNVILHNDLIQWIHASVKQMRPTSN